MNTHLPELCKKLATPFYLYDERIISENISRFTRIPYRPKTIHFASMANDNPVLLDIIRKTGFGIFVNSMKHLTLAIKVGFEPERIIYATTGMSTKDLEFLIRHNIRVNLDTLDQIRRYGSLAPGGSVGIRLNTEERSRVDSYVSGANSRIGLLPSELPEALELARQKKLRIVGTHVYLGTDIVTAEEMLAGVRRTLDLSRAFPDLEYVDFGGGFPVASENNGQFDFERYRLEITSLLESYSQERGRSIHLILEPGRSLFGDSAVFCTRVLEVKERPDRYLVSCDSSVGIFPRPLIYGVYHPVSVVGRDSETNAEKPSDVVGSTTYSRDFLIRGAALPRVQPGDTLIFKSAGSYCYSMITRFLGQPLPSEILLDCEGNALTIRGPETFETELHSAFAARALAARVSANAA